MKYKFEINCLFFSLKVLTIGAAQNVEILTGRLLNKYIYYFIFLC